jgi:transposase
MVSIRDFRKQDPATQSELRRVAVKMVHAGRTRVEAAEAVGAGRHSVGAWVGAVARSGETTLDSGRRSRRPDEQKALSPEQEIWITRLITENCPNRLGMPFALWTREAVSLLIERETGVHLSSRSTVGNYLRGWQFTPQRARKRASERSDPAVRALLDRDYPGIVARTKAEGAEIHWVTRRVCPTKPTMGVALPP